MGSYLKFGSYLRLVSFLRMIKKETVCKICIVLAITATYVIQAVAIAHGVAAVFQHQSIAQIAVFPAVAGVAILVRGFLVRLNEAYSRTMAAKVKGHIRDTLLEKLLLLGPGYQSRKRSGNMTSLITDGVEAMEPFLVNYLPQVFVALITVSVLVAYIMTLDWLIGLIVLIAVIVAVIGPHLTLPFVSNSTIRYWQSYAVLNSQYIDSMQGMNTLKVFNASRAKGKELGENAYQFYRDSLRSTTYSLIDSAVIILFIAIGSSISVAMGAWHTSFGTLAAVNLSVILFLVPECVRPITDLNGFWHASYLGFSVAEQFYEILDEPVKVQENESPICGWKQIEDALPSVVLENVSFTYEGKDEEALSGINFKIEPGQAVAVVGKSGSGKSTLVSLLLRFYDVSAGRILFCGHDLRDYSLEFLRSKIAVVFQDTYLFYGTLEENLKIAKPDATFEEIVAAAKIANAHQFIMDFPGGYATIVGERGATLSGGERQRIAIARAVLKDAPFLILDEATSSVDAANEKLIKEALDKLMVNRTTMIIAHRLSTIKNAKRIFVLEKGHLVEAGTHQELIHRHNIYAQLIELQQAGGGAD